MARSCRAVHRPLLPLSGVALLTALAVRPGIVGAQVTKAGVVTTVEGQVTARRVVLPQPVPLKFKDDVFLQDTITTGDRSFARLLLGGKAVVSVRERSALTITEVPGRSTVEMDTGKVGLAVARERMRPGELLDVRTPNAIVAVRGTVLVVEVRRATAQAVPAAGAPTTEVNVVRGAADVTQLDPLTGTPIGPPVLVGPMQRFSATGAAPGAVAPVRPEELDRITGDLQPRGRPHERAANQDQVTAQHLALATELLTALGIGRDRLALGLPGDATTAPRPTPHPSVLDLGLHQTTATTALTAPTSPGTGGTPTGLINGGFESGTSAGWTVEGAGGVLSEFGPQGIRPPEGSFMFFGHTGAGAISQPGCPGPGPCQTTTLRQTFTATKPLLHLSFQYLLMTNEVGCGNQGCTFGPTATPPEPGPAPNARPDTWALRVVSASGATSVFATHAEEETSAGRFIRNTAGVDVTVDGFTLFGDAAQSPGFQAISQTVVVEPGPVTIEFTVSDVGDDLFDSAALLDAVAVAQDPPLYFLRDGGSYVRTDPSPLLRLVDAALGVDSIMVVCCGSSATLAGPLLHATNSRLTVPFSLLGVIQGGTLATTSTEALVRLEGGEHAIGTIVGIFDLAGVATARDPETGLTLGTDQPLRHAGPLLATAGAAVETRKVLALDTALLEATAPILALTAGSRLTTALAAIDLSSRAKVAALGPLVSLDASALTVRSGALVNVAGGSGLHVSRDLVRLANGSALTLANGPLLSASGGAVVHVSGALVAFAGPGNALTVANALCPCAVVGGIPVALVNGAVASNVSIGPAPIKGTGTVSLAPGAALLLVSGPTTRVTVAGR